MGHAPILRYKAILIVAIVLELQRSYFYRWYLTGHPARIDRTPSKSATRRIGVPDARTLPAAIFCEARTKRQYSFKVAFGWLSIVPCPWQARPQRYAATSPRDLIFRKMQGRVSAPTRPQREWATMRL